MTPIPRTDTSMLGRWWWTVDHLTLGAIGALILFGVILTMAASPPVALRIGHDEMYFVRRQLTILPVAIMAIVAVSLMTPAQIRLLALAVFAGSLVLLVMTLLVGSEVKGAQRWLNIGGFSLQVSEFVKPSFAVVAAWLFAREARKGAIPPAAVCVVLYVAVAALLMAQPDVGQTVVVTSVWLAQFFLAGLSLWLVGGLVAIAVLGFTSAYFLLPHVARRIDSFLDPSQGDSYQINRSLDAFRNGGLFGLGPGEGQVKNSLPDAHADFIFAVAGEELGMILTLVIVGLFGFVVLRGFARAFLEKNLFLLLAVAGLLTQFGLQALINMGSTLQLLPTKGMTLPFISYGGSSLLATGLGIGMVLALTRRRVGGGDEA